MKRILTIASVFVLMIGALVLTGCGGGSGQDEALVGTWYLSGSNDSHTTYVFNSDGTGSRSAYQFNETFRWTTNGDRLNVNRDNAPSGEIRNERWTYTVGGAGNSLTLDSQQETGWRFNYARVEQDNSLVGNWNLYDFFYVFNANGTGAFNIQNVENLNRLRVSMDSLQIIDLAGNSPTQNMDVLPVIQHGRTLVPVRFMAYALGAGIDFTEATENWPLTVHLTLDGQHVEMPVGMLSNQLQALGMDVPAQIINERTMVPLRFISEFFGASVTWDDATRSIEIIR